MAYNKKFQKKFQKKQGEQEKREYNTIDLYLAARDSQSTKGPARDVLVALIFRTGLDMNYASWPSYELLAHDTMRSPSTVKAAVKELKEMGLITSHRQYNSSNVYVLNAHLLMQQAETRRAEKAKDKRRKMLGLGASDKAEAELEAPEQQATTERTIKPRPRKIRIKHDTIANLLESGELDDSGLSNLDLDVLGVLRRGEKTEDGSGYYLDVDSRWHSNVDNPAQENECPSCLGSGWSCNSRMDQDGNTLTIEWIDECPECHPEAYEDDDDEADTGSPVAIEAAPVKKKLAIDFDEDETLAAIL